MSMRVFGYVRISTDNQIENYSIEEQTQRLRAYCLAKGWALVNVYTDGGYSGGNTDRPALQAMLREVRMKVVDAVIVYKLDRLSRNQKDTLTIIEDELLKNGVDFISVNENFDTSTPFGRAMIGILSVFAQLEKDQITERFTMGRIGRSKAGYFHGGGNAPYGYTYTDGELQVNEREAAHVREVYRLFLEGKSINAIGRLMQVRCGGSWAAAKVRNILTNSIYGGKVKFAGEEYPGRHVPIVTGDVQARVAQILASSAREDRKTAAQKTPFRANYLLSGLLYCRHCGARYSGDHGYYKCYSRAKSSRRFIVDPNCKNNHWHSAELDRLVVQEINDMLRNPGLLDETIANAPQSGANVDRGAATRQLAEIGKQTERLIELYQVGTIPIERVKQRLEKLDAEKKQVESLIVKAGESCADRKASFLRVLRLFQEKYDSADLEMRRFLISSLIQAVYLDGESAAVNWRV